MTNSKKLFIFLSLTIAIIDILFVTSNYFSAHDTLQQTLNDKAKNDFAIFQTIEDSTYNGIAMQASLFAGNSNIQDLFLAGKKALQEEGGNRGGVRTAQLRKKLYTLVEKPWKNTTKKFDILHFHFHLGPGAMSYLRIHKPEKFGDRLDKLRFLIVDTDAEQTPRSGFETGRASSALRTAVPIFAFDQTVQKKVYVGVLEISTSYKKMLQAMEKNIQIETSILLNKQHIEQTVWDEFIDGQYHNKTISECNCMLEATSNPKQKSFLEHITKKVDFNSQILNADKKVQILSANKHFYAVTFQPFRDYKGIKTPSRNNIGAIVMSRNIDQLIASYKNKQFFSIIYGIIAYLIVELLLILTFFRATYHLNAQLTFQSKKLLEQKQHIESDNVKCKNLTDTMNNNYFFYSRDNKNNFTFVSPAIKKILGCSSEEFITNTHLYLPEKTRAILAKRSSLPEQNKNAFEINITNKAARQQYFRITETEKYDENDQLIKTEGLAQDISHTHQETLLLNLQYQILQLIIEKETKEKIITKLLLGIEEIITDINCAIMLVDEKTGTLSVIAPHLPTEFVNTLTNLHQEEKNSLKSMGCLVAIHTLKRKIIPDMQLLLGGTNASELLKQNHYYASCSEPVLSDHAKILASIDFYYKQIGKPSHSDLQIIAAASDLATKILS